MENQKSSNTRFLNGSYPLKYLCEFFMDSEDIWHQLGPYRGPSKNVSEISVGTLRGVMGAEISAGQKKIR